MLSVGMTLTVLLSDVMAEETLKGSSAVFVIEKASGQGSKSGDKIDRYTPANKPGPDKWMVAFAKAPANSTVLIVAFEPNSDNLYRNIPPVISDQTDSSGVVKFPNPKSNVRWPYHDEEEKVELFVFISTKGAPETVTLRKHANGVISAINNNQQDAKLLYSAELKSEISRLIRSRSRQDFIVRYPSVSIAGTRRGIPEGTKLPTDWNKKSDPVSFSKGRLGLLLFRIPPDN